VRVRAQGAERHAPLAPAHGRQHPTIEFVFEEDPGNGLGFRSRAERYRIFHIFRRGQRGVHGGTISVRTRDGRTITLDELIAERNAAVAPALP
jgi:hypothetical protein